MDFVNAFKIELSLDKEMYIYTADKNLIKSEAVTEKGYKIFLPGTL